MKNIRVSDEVWNAIAANGKFGETEDDVLRRVFKLKDTSNESSNSNGDSYRWKERRATDAMRKEYRGNRLILQFDSGPKFERVFPPKDDHRAIRELRDAAVDFVRSNQGTKGQEHAAIKALTDKGYHVTVKREYE